MVQRVCLDLWLKILAIVITSVWLCLCCVVGVGGYCGNGDGVCGCLRGGGGGGGELVYVGVFNKQGVNNSHNQQ